MVKTKSNVIQKDAVVVKFVGDSGDGMQLSGTLFSDTAALEGLDLATFPDYPAEIRAPHNTIAGVSGFQVHVGAKKIETTGDLCDVLVAMNPASLKANLKWAKPGATIIVDENAFDEAALKKSGYADNPLENGTLSGYNLVKAPVTLLTREAVKHLSIDNKSAERSKNMFALGMMYHLFGWGLKHTFEFFEKKFKNKPDVIAANKAVLEAGFNYAETIEALASVYQVSKAKMEPGRYRNITGNVATAWGFLAASERSGRPLFLGSYPITPATEILIELAKYKSLGAKVFQAEDEIAGICSAIGASYTGSLALTSTSGPGLSLKSEAIGLAVMTELPLVIVNVQRGGPSTGLPTKSEQSDLYQALFGRNGECPVVVIAASSSANCFYYAYMASKIAMEHMTPVILLTDGYLGNGSQLFRIPKVAELPDIKPPIAQPNDPDFKPYRRNPETLARKWALPGTEGLRHRVGGLEKEDIFGNVSTDPLNHQKMVDLREAKVQKVAEFIPEQEIAGAKEGDVLVVSWGGTFGPVSEAVEALQKEGKSISHAHFNYIMPLPKNTANVLNGFKKVIVCELNSGQFVNYLKMTHPGHNYLKYNKVQGLPFTVTELVNVFNATLEDK
ncbi:2-oxoglutarate oxidoreductase subunit KorA [bioreactor metagenome]|jgi:2-oxoglutarate ferredoxin oxidoreductase subunit alpha|uniref:2-oxoglutarate oxidoreductase subunit KorA n=1 Tax=bioreactor metagenome TaxID=1076179 RepID=A0A644UVK6_9ZZZZ|nr:2-oxoacid:acceptor oxidoreductase subunit alpha [Lentimicrobium sp.]MEA5110295.1 2-oxoacid:acceptor oxidoreductase subunit alpha [Lentimicrobium sp.]